MIGDDDCPTEYTYPPFVTLPIATGTPTHGLWCETCLLPSRHEVPLYTLAADGPHRIGTATYCDGGCEA